MRILLPLAVLVALALPATAQECEWTTSRAVEVGERYYYVQDDCPPLCNGQIALVSAWIYEETNVIEGLQRSDRMQDDTCAGMIESDTIVW